MAPILILFDLDDTLCDYASARSQRLRNAFATAFALAPSVAPPDFDQMIEDSISIHPHGADHFADLIARYGVTVEQAAIAAKRWYQTNRFHGLKLFDDAIPMLTGVRMVNPERRIGMITNGPAEVQRAKIELLKVEPYFDFMIVSGEFGVAKPDPAIFEHALALGNAGADETIFIGDSPEFDIAGARGAGIRSVWVNRTDRVWPHSTFAPDHEVESLTALHTLLIGETS